VDSFGILNVHERFFGVVNGFKWLEITHRSGNEPYAPHA
jgi:hypothetical protein